MLPEHALDTYQRQRGHRKLFLLTLLSLMLIGAIYFLLMDPTKNPKVTLSRLNSSEGKVAAAYTWRPDLTVSTTSAQPLPQLYAKSALAMNLDTGDIFYTKNPQMELPMASITKIMTILVTLDHNKPSDLFTVSSEAASVGENSMGVLAGEKYTVNELLYGILMQSGNDAAETLAENVAGTKKNFVEQMNNKAQELGMFHTHYTNPTGLEGDGHMYTTAEDLAIITKYTLDKYPWLLDISKNIDYTLPANQNHHEVILSSELDLVRTYPGTIGFKGGFTDEAMYCIVSVTQDQGQRMVAIVLGSTNRRVDAVKLLDYSFGALGIKIPHQAYW